MAEQKHRQEKIHRVSVWIPADLSLAGRFLRNTRGVEPAEPTHTNPRWIETSGGRKDQQTPEVNRGPKEVENREDRNDWFFQR